MKKLLFSVFLISLSLCVFAGNNNGSQKVNESNGNVKEYKNFSHWSIAVDGGFNMFLGERTSKGINTFANYKDNFAYGAKFQVEYMINPCWGFALQYQFASINKAAMSESLRMDKNPYTNDVTVKGVVNLLNLFERNRYSTNWNFLVGVGGGAAFYKSYSRNAEDKLVGEDKFTFVLPVSLSVEFNPINSLGIFFDAQVRWYPMDDINGIVGGRMNDMGLYGGLGLRYHIAATKRPHVRTVCMQEYEPLGIRRAPEVKAVEKYEKDEDDVTPIDAPTRSEYESRIKDLQDQVDKLGRVVYNMSTSDSAKSKDVNLIAPENRNIYFDYKSTEIKPDYLMRIAQIARTMILYKNLHLEVLGYCDEVGTYEYNKDLAQQRCDAVVAVLVERYKIERSRIVTSNIGSIEGISELSRRVEMILK
ncbi:MAG: OmpA family protein [Paludibacteraceae bacterium]|nr:OmpA family protein [Paludibacteraceae bacterium]